MDQEMKYRSGRQERFFAFQTRSEEEGSMKVEGRAVVFDTPTVLFVYNGVEYKEQIDSRAFEEADMSDVIFNYNHCGKVMARIRNKTLQLEVREDGVYMSAELSGTKEGRDMYEEIQGGYIDRMSFAFTVREESYDEVNHTWTVRKIKKLYDVSAVSTPAYEETSINARNNFLLEADAQEERKRKAAAEVMRQRLKLKLKLQTTKQEER